MMTTRKPYRLSDFDFDLPGELIAQGASPEEAAAAIGQVVEGLTTAPVLRDLAHRLDIELPITEGVCQVLAGVDLLELVSTLMGRRPREE
jgi:glycerol-3-phosphate dehydrogenase (NAD(P)+)